MDYNTLRKVCEKNSRISAKVIDDFLINFAAGHQNLEKKMNQQFAVYRHVSREFDKGWIGLLQAQYLGHRIFRNEGLINKFLNHPALRRFNQEEMELLRQYAKLPWRFSFSEITDNPAADFFMMEDVFSGFKFQLFSPGVSDLVQKQPPVLWFNLIAFNGYCWQSFGPIGAYKSFEPDDIFFFATEINPDIEDESEIMADVEDNPIPYMMLLSGANYPLTFHKEDQLVHVLSEFDLDSINSKELKKSFKTEYNSGVYRFTLKEWGEHPHFANAYYDEQKKIILLTAMTGRGFNELVSAINKYGYDFPNEPFLRVNTSMLVTAKDILKKKELQLNEYEQLFQIESPPEDKEAVDKLNIFMNLILPDINSGREPDIESLARKAGVDIETARDLVSQIMGKFGDMDS